MAITYHGGNIIRGTAADRTGGTWTNLQSGYLFVESDTQLIYYWNGTAWAATSTAGTFLDQTLKLRNPANTFTSTLKNPAVAGNATLELGYNLERYIVYFDSADSLYKLKNPRLETVDQTSATPDSIIQAACDLGDYTYIVIRDGFYPINATSGTLFKLHLNQHIFLSKGARIQVPQGFTGTVFSFNNSNSGAVSPLYSTLEGGFLEELGTPARNWTGIELNSTTSTGVIFNKINGVRMLNPGTGILLKCDGSTSFVNNNTIDNIVIGGHKIGLDFQLTNSGTVINGNDFNNVSVNSDSNALYGFKNVTGTANIFNHCLVWDPQLAPSSITSNFLSTATKNVIIGGFMTTQGWTDASLPLANFYIDQYSQGLIVPHSQTARYWGHDDPEIEKTGTWHGTSNTISITGTKGLLDGKIGLIGPTTTQMMDTTGHYTRFTTGTTVNTVSGIYIAPITEKDLIPRFRIKFKLSSAAQIRLTIMFHSNGANAPVSSSTPLANYSGGGLYFDSTLHANWRYTMNDGSASAPAPYNPGVAADSSIHTLEVRAIPGSTSMQFSLDNAAFTNMTVQYPAPTTDLGAYIYIENTTAGASKDLDIWWLKWRQDL